MPPTSNGATCSSISWSRKLLSSVHQGIQSDLCSLVEPLKGGRERGTGSSKSQQTQILNLTTTVPPPRDQRACESCVRSFAIRFTIHFGSWICWPKTRFGWAFPRETILFGSTLCTRTSRTTTVHQPAREDGLLSSQRRRRFGCDSNFHFSLGRSLREKRKREKRHGVCRSIGRQTGEHRQKPL
jgi:hypothetical protein